MDVWTRVHYNVVICMRTTVNDKKIKEEKEKRLGRTQSTVLDTLLHLIETASGTNRLREGFNAMARQKEETENSESQLQSEDGSRGE